MQQEPKSQRKRAADLIRLLVPDDWRNWRPTSSQVLSAVRIIIVLVVLLALFFLVAAWLWGVIAHYVGPKTPSDRKDLVNVFVVIGAGVIGFLTATAAVGNLYFSRRNLEQQHIIEERRFQDEALQAYYTQLGDLLTEHALKKTKPEDDVALLARAQTLTVVRRLDASRKGDLVRFLYGAGLISGDGAIVDLFGANLFGADLVGADLSGVNLRGVNLALAHLSGAADLRRADLSEAKLSWADLVGANLFGANLQGANLFGALLRHADLGHADLSGVNLRDADLRYADLRDARNVTEEQLEEQAASLKGATMPNGQMYEEWIKSKD